MTAADLKRGLRLIVVTDSKLAHPRSVLEVVRETLRSGAPSVQLRNKGEPTRQLLALGHVLRQATRETGALLFVNDRLDLALALEADGVHLGPEDLPVRVVRRVAPPGFLIGRSADDPEVARTAVSDGADYIGCGTVYPTSTKRDVGDVIGLDGLRRVVGAVSVPVVAIGGITPDRAPELAATGATGVAVVGALMAAHDPAAAVRALMEPFVS